MQFYNLKSREALLEAGIGYGKSRVASIKLAALTQEFPGTNWIMAAKDYKQLKTSVDREFEHYLHDIFGMRRGIDYRKTNGSPIEYEFVSSGSRIFGHSAVNYDTAFRAGNYSGAWGDEVDYWKPEAVKALRGRIRVYPEIIRFTSSPRGYNHIYEDFYLNEVGPVINAPTTENPTLSDEFIQSLKASYDDLFYQQEVLAERLNITAGRVYYAFDEEKQAKEKQAHDPHHPIWVGMDFNPHKMAVVIGQVKGNTLHIIDEIFDTTPGANTEKVCKELLLRYKYANQINVVPDSTGKKATSNSSRSDHDIIRSFGFKIHVTHNPFRIDRYAAVNAALDKGFVVIDQACRYTKKDLQRVTYKEGTDKPDDGDPNLTHMSDAFGYLVYKTVNPLKAPVKKISTQSRF